MWMLIDLLFNPPADIKVTCRVNLHCLNRLNFFIFTGKIFAHFTNFQKFLELSRHVCVWWTYWTSISGTHVTIESNVIEKLSQHFSATRNENVENFFANEVVAIFLVFPFAFRFGRNFLDKSSRIVKFPVINCTIIFHSIEFVSKIQEMKKLDRDKMKVWLWKALRKFSIYFLFLCRFLSFKKVKDEAAMKRLKVKWNKWGEWKNNWIQLQDSGLGKVS